MYAGLVVLTCLVAGCQSATDQRRLSQFLGGGKEEDAAGQAAEYGAAPNGQLSLAKPASLGPAEIGQPPSDAAGVPTLAGPELYPGTGLSVQAAAQTNPVIQSATGDI